MARPIAFRRDFGFDYGAAEQVSPLIRRVVARNPSPFTFRGTGTYIVGHGRVAVIDPGPVLTDHVAALLAAVAGETVSHILITHTHLDHSPAAAVIQQRTGAPTFGFGPHGRPRGGAGGTGEEGADLAFRPDHRLEDGVLIAGDGWTLQPIHTPGHTSNHLCFALPEERALFTGDHVMGWSTSVISPPDGDMAAYLASLRRLQGRGDATFWPTHGPPIRETEAHLEAFIGHREDREAEILACLAAGPAAIPLLVARIYVGLEPSLHRAAGRTVLAHLIALVEAGRVCCEGAPGADSVFRLTEAAQR